MNNSSWTRNEFKQALLALAERYHIHHPYHIAMTQGKLNKHQIQGWVANRYYYQIMIPRKDAAILANCPDQAARKLWIRRIIEHDGAGSEKGGIEAWLRLGDAVGLDRQKLQSQVMVLPGVRFAVDAYYNFVRNAPWQEAMCSSLTELFAPEIHKQRLQTWPQQYKWIEADGLSYFQKRLKEAPRDVQHGLEITFNYFTTREQQQRAIEIVRFKCDVLWSMLDAMHMAYINNT